MIWFFLEIFTSFLGFFMQIDANFYLPKLSITTVYTINVQIDDNLLPINHLTVKLRFSFFVSCSQACIPWKRPVEGTRWEKPRLRVASKRWKEANRAVVYMMAQYAGKREKGRGGVNNNASQIVQDHKKRGECECLMWFGRVSSSGCAPTELRAALWRSSRRVSSHWNTKAG